MCKQRSLLCMTEDVFAQVDFLDLRQKSLILFHIQVSIYLACWKGLQVEEDFKGANVSMNIKICLEGNGTR